MNGGRARFVVFFITLPQVPYGFVCADNSMRIVIEKTLKLPV